MFSKYTQAYDVAILEFSNTDNKLESAPQKPSEWGLSGRFCQFSSFG